MPWDISGTGKAPAVAAKIKKDFATQPVQPQPSETVRQLVASLIAEALKDQGANVGVAVTAAGNQIGSNPNLALPLSVLIQVLPDYT